MEDNLNSGHDEVSLPGKQELGRRLMKHVKKEIRKLERAYSDSISKNDPDAVHDVRVATRRLGSVLDVVAFANPEKAAKKARKRLKKLRHILSEERDIDVLLKTMQERARNATNERRAQLWTIAIRQTRREGDAARSESTRWLKGFDLDALDTQIKKVVRKHLKGGFAWRDLSAVADRAEQKWRQATKQARAGSESSQFHDVRIKTKTLRYLIELVPRLTGNDTAGNQIEWLKNIQDELGEWHDQAELCRRLTAALSETAGLQADPIATAMIDTARGRTRFNDQHARRTIDSMRNVNAKRQIAAAATHLNGSDTHSDR
jgi:CHAD domain-containing protein